MASGEFVWFLGDDDLLIPTAIEKLTKIINNNQGADFFWINSFYLDSFYLKKIEAAASTRGEGGHGGSDASTFLDIF